MEGYSFSVNEQILQQDLYYKGSKVMSYTIKYPEFQSDSFPILADKLSLLYRTKANMYEKSVVNNLYQQAMVEYEYSIANNFPIREYEAYVDYKITYNQNCMLSLYFDQYEYTGGAHGATIRTSDTWNLQQSRKLQLKDLFLLPQDYSAYITDRVKQQIAGQIASGEDIYFDDYAHLVSDYFKPNNFYLTKEGAEFYYQQYDIAPYSSGIRTFLIPYSQNGIVEPRCCY
ncbi:MAG TPA: DUF3298/DUF4163 domain-containing protein [Lachnospiraceae bacterium]|jgi:hypothetical protein|nr:DUF3298/DUF4163 domain-containing protein [Lachnospiraceae bacterium]HBY71583.1 DUF3298/DUF4163 domain-containing protein [Lachnospiraceae bacterium]HCA70522.1 DUF3298/DUF4163 domain-containing protein [Lachnospiraceae bacterium]HCM11769.1 DUF3298/DUF4163 domain-containing protein [Lachnospiraceae bacterium]